MNRLGLAAIWVAVTAVTTFVAWQIVAAAGSEVNASPLTPVRPAVTTVEQSTTTTSVPTTTTSPSTSTTVPTVATETTAPSSTTSTTSESTSTTSTTAQASWQVKTIPTSGGTLVVSYRPGEVSYDAATPAPGFSTKLKEKGPPSVEVAFESESRQIEIKVEWDGKLIVEIGGEDTEGNHEGGED